MRLLIIGTVLILYACFLSPCFFEPSDIIVSTGYIIMANEMGIDPIFIWLWIISGYIALIVGIGLLGHSIIRRIPTIAVGVKNLIALVLLIIFIASVVCLWFAYVA